MDKSIEELIDQLNLIRARKVQREMERGKIKVDEIRSDYGVPGMKWKNHNPGADVNIGTQSKNFLKKTMVKPMPQPKRMTKGALTAISKGVVSPRSRMTGGANYSRTGMMNSLRSGNGVTKYANGRGVASANWIPKMRGATAKQIKVAGNPKDSNGGDAGVKYNSNGTVSDNENVSWLDKELGIGKNGMANVIDNMKSQNEKNEAEQPSE